MMVAVPANPGARAICGAKKRNPENPGLCKKPAGWGTSHAGIGRCRLHGGNMRGQQVSVAKTEFHAMGIPQDIEPHEGILWCIRIVAGEVAFMSEQIEALTEPELVERSLAGRQLNLWVRERHAAMERLARWCKLALDVGIAERHVRIAERYGELLARAFADVFAKLQLTPKQLKIAPEAVRESLLALEAGVPKNQAVA